MPTEVAVTPPAVVVPKSITRSGLYLVSSAAAVQRPEAPLLVEDLAAIEARLIGRAKFF